MLSFSPAPWLLGLYESLPQPIQRVDLIRILYMFFYGGVYCDLDIVPTSNFESLLDLGSLQDIALVRTSNVSSTTNCFFASKQYSRFWLVYLRIVVSRFFRRGWWHMLPHTQTIFLTGPQAITEAVKLYEGPVCYLPDCFVYSDVSGRKIRNETYTREVQGRSWNQWDSRIINFVLRHTDLFIGFILFILALGIVLIYEQRKLLRLRNRELVAQASRTKDLARDNSRKES